MMFSLAKSLALLALTATTLAIPNTHNPFKRAGNASMPTDTQVLQYALTLENLESTFYNQALTKYSQQDFEDAGYPAWVRNRVSQVAMHEASHVKLLTAALGNQSVAACEYAFPYTDVRSFLVFACGLENIGVSAYLGAAQYITEPSYVTIAGSILTVEARHQSFFYAPVLKQSPWTGPYDTPLGLDMVYTLAAQLITSCPDSNAVNPLMLPTMAYPALTVMMMPIFNAAAGSSIMLSYNGSDSQSGDTYAAFYNGLGSTTVKINNGNVTLPEGLQGYSFVLVTSSSTVAGVTMGNIVAGPAEIQTSFASTEANPGFMNPLGA
ncbi:hypothetical protein P7C73_g3222, partial [Tremellales sp. Uapishka_1]